MDERQIGLALALKESGVSSDVSDFDSRLILQKSVYLLQAAGIKLGYAFNWYLRGPYSPALTRDLYEASSTADIVAGWELDSNSEKTAKKLAPLFEKQDDASLGKARRLELLASLHYLSSRRRVQIDDVDQAMQQLTANGKDFTREQVEQAVEELREYCLV